MKIRREAYAGLYGPTTGDRVRLGDTNLILRGRARSVTAHGEEVVFGGGKVIRDGQGQSQKSRGPRAHPTSSSPTSSSSITGAS